MFGWVRKTLDGSIPHLKSGQKGQPCLKNAAQRNETTITCLICKYALNQWCTVKKGSNNRNNFQQLITKCKLKIKFRRQSLNQLPHPSFPYSLNSNPSKPFSPPSAITPLPYLHLLPLSPPTSFTRSSCKSPSSYERNREVPADYSHIHTCTVGWVPLL